MYKITSITDKQGNDKSNYNKIKVVTMNSVYVFEKAEV